MIFAIVAAWLAYKRAQESNRNAILWAVVTAGAFVGTQLVVGLGVGVFLGLGIAFWGWSETIIEDYNIGITLVAVAASIGVAALILRYLGKIPEETTYVEPPQPPKFD